MSDYDPDSDSRAWFRPKRYGFGISPRNGKGWAATLVFIVLMIGAGLARPVVGPAISALLVVLVIVLFTILIAATSSRKPWKWRWGGRE